MDKYGNNREKLKAEPVVLGSVKVYEPETIEKNWKCIISNIPYILALIAWNNREKLKEDKSEHCENREWKSETIEKNWKLITAQLFKLICEFVKQ